MPLPPVYTELVYENEFLTAEPGGINIGGPPAGFRWVIVDIEVFDGVTGSEPRQGFFLQDSSNVILWIEYYPLSWSGHFQWKGRQVLDHPNTLTYVCYDAVSTLRITAYVLSLP